MPLILAETKHKSSKWSRSCAYIGTLTVDIVQNGPKRLLDGFPSSLTLCVVSIVLFYFVSFSIRCHS